MEPEKIYDLEIVKERTLIRKCDHCGERYFYLHDSNSAECVNCGAYVAAKKSW